MEPKITRNNVSSQRSDLYQPPVLTILTIAAETNFAGSGGNDVNAANDFYAIDKDGVIYEW